MTDTNHNTSDIESIDWTARREAALDKALADLQRFEQERPGEDVDVSCDVVDAVVDQILTAPLESLADVRLYAKALRKGYEGCLVNNEPVERLLTTLEALPKRLWDEKIAPD